MRYRINSEVLHREVVGETVLLDLEGEGYYGLGEVGTRIWQLIGSNATRDTILRTLQREYQADPEVLARDLDELLDQLRDAGLISEVAE
jgi:hypothetical protein